MASKISDMTTCNEEKPMEKNAQEIVDSSSKTKENYYSAGELNTMASKISDMTTCNEEKPRKKNAEEIVDPSSKTIEIEFFPINDHHAQEVNSGEESNHEALNTIRHNKNKKVLAHDAEEIDDEPQNTNLRGTNEKTNNGPENTELVICIGNSLGLSSCTGKRSRTQNIVIDQCANSHHMSDEIDGGGDHLVNLFDKKRLKCEAFDLNSSINEETCYNPMKSTTLKSEILEDVKGDITEPSSTQEMVCTLDLKKFQCDRCSVLCTSEVDFSNHLNGKRHARICKKSKEDSSKIFLSKVNTVNGQVQNDAHFKENEARKERSGSNDSFDILLKESRKKFCFEPLITSLLSSNGGDDPIAKSLNLALAATLCPGIENMNNGNGKEQACQSSKVDFMHHNVVTMHSLCLLNMMRDLRTARLEDLLRSSSSSVLKENDGTTIPCISGTD